MITDDKLKLEEILKVIAGDEDLINQFALAIGENPKEFGDWIEVVQVN